MVKGQIDSFTHIHTYKLWDRDRDWNKSGFKKNLLQIHFN